MNFRGRDVVSIREFSRQEIERVLHVARDMLPVAERRKRSNMLDGYVLSTFFYEPSTRTRLSFQSAICRLGGRYIGFADPAVTSMKKGETLADTVKMAEAYSDAMVLRHPHEGAARLAAEFCSKPVINAGDGAGQHPTQTMLDLFTIKEELGSIDGKTVAMVGDLKYGRTVHSLSYALAMFGAELIFVSPRELQMPKDIVESLSEQGAKLKSTTRLDEAVKEADAVYVTRIQKERFPDPNEYQKVAGIYQINAALLKDAPEDLIVMHPLPRVTEISPEVDPTKHALYFKQAFYGVPVRMALLALVLGEVE
ncbi:MAG: aspartate carbamoyltransferase [Euryarchaeota archaeon]|nr:aspartate carbamoyltransferase [Euryarchaeota archaeon]